MPDRKRRAQRRKTTSAIPGLSVSEQRHYLSEIRGLLATPEKFTLLHELAPNYNVYRFCTELEHGTHCKRTTKN